MYSTGDPGGKSVRDPGGSRGIPGGCWGLLGPLPNAEQSLLYSPTFSPGGGTKNQRLETAAVAAERCSGLFSGRALKRSLLKETAAAVYLKNSPPPGKRERCSALFLKETAPEAAERCSALLRSFV